MIIKLTVVMEMKLDKEFDVEVKWEVTKEVAKDALMFIMCSNVFSCWKSLEVDMVSIY